MSDLSSRFSNVSGVNGLVAGRFGGRAISLMPGGTLIKTLTAPINKGTLGFAFRLNVDQGVLVINFTTAAGLSNFAVVITLAGFVEVWTGAYLTGTKVETSVTPLVQMYAWTYCGIQGICDPVYGSVTVHINGTKIVAPINIDTSADGGTVMRAIKWELISTSPVSTAYLDDMYFCDSAGPPPYNGFLGVCRIQTAYPIADGSHSEFTPSEALANWRAVSDPAMDIDGSYTMSSVDDALDTFRGTTLSIAGTVLAVEPQVAARTDDSGAIRTALLVGGTVYDGVVTPADIAYGYVSDVYVNNPATGRTWTNTAVSNLEFGYRKA